MFVLFRLVFSMEACAGSHSSCSRNFWLAEESCEAETWESRTTYSILQEHRFPKFSFLIGRKFSLLDVISKTTFSFLCKDDDSLENTYIYSCWLGFLLVCFYFLSGHSLYTVEQLCFTNVISECRMLLLYELKISDKWKSTDSIWYMYRYALLFTILTIQRVYIYI